MNTMIYPTTNFKAIEQMVVARGEGVYVYDDHGKRYLEGMAGLWCTALGYGNEEIIDCAAEQMRTLTFSHMFGGKTHPVAMELADKIAAMVPVKDAHVFFGSSGSDANDTQIKMIRYSRRRHRQAGKTQNHRPGQGLPRRHGGRAALTGLPANHTHFSLPFDALGILRTGSPHYYREGSARRERGGLCRATNESELEALIEKEGGGYDRRVYRRAGQRRRRRHRAACKTTLIRLQQVLDKYDIMLWDDEVICGFGRLGHDFGASALSACDRSLCPWPRPCPPPTCR
jgi:4-aminobutyrate--pyruvate transaminase